MQQTFIIFRVDLYKKQAHSHKRVGPEVFSTKIQEELEKKARSPKSRCSCSGMWKLFQRKLSIGQFEPIGFFNKQAFLNQIWFSITPQQSRTGPVQDQYRAKIGMGLQCTFIEGQKNSKIIYGVSILQKKYKKLLSWDFLDTMICSRDCLFISEDK